MFSVSRLPIRRRWQKKFHAMTKKIGIFTEQRLLKFWNSDCNRSRCLKMIPITSNHFSVWQYSYISSSMLFITSIICLQNIQVTKTITRKTAIVFYAFHRSHALSYECIYLPSLSQQYRICNNKCVARSMLSLQ